MPPPQPQQGTGFVSLGDYLTANSTANQNAMDAASGKLTAASQAVNTAAGGLSADAAAAGKAAGASDWQGYQSQLAAQPNYYALGEDTPLKPQQWLTAGANYQPDPNAPVGGLYSYALPSYAKPPPTFTNNAANPYDPTQTANYGALQQALTTKQNTAQGTSGDVNALAGGFFGGQNGPVGGSNFDASLLSAGYGGALDAQSKAAQGDAMGNYTGGLQAAYTGAYNAQIPQAPKASGGTPNQPVFNPHAYGGPSGEAPAANPNWTPTNKRIQTGGGGGP